MAKIVANNVEMPPKTPRVGKAQRRLGDFRGMDVQD